MKPSSRVIEILRGLQMENNSDIEIDFLRFHAVLQYLDEQSESQEPKASEDCRFCPTKNGVHIHPCIKDVECQRCGLPYDAHTQILDHGFKAKPQKEPKKCCDKCNRKQLGGGTSCIDLQCPCHQKETEPSRL